MECTFEIDVRKSDTTDMLFRPFVKFRLKQLNITPECMNDDEIDYQANQLIEKVEELRKIAKRKLKAAKSRHDKMLSERKKS